jgi:hypothetical protein
MSATIAQKRTFRAIDRTFPLRVNPAKVPLGGGFVPPMVIQGRVLGSHDPTKTPAKNRTEYFAAMRAWIKAGSKPHPVFSPEAWHAVAYDEDTHLALARATMLEVPGVHEPCGTVLGPDGKCPRCTHKVHARSCARFQALALGRGRVEECTCGGRQ